MSLSWVTRSPVRMLVLIAFLVGLPVMILGQMLVDGGQRALREVELDNVGAGAAAGAEVVAVRMAELLQQTRSIASAEDLGHLVGNADESALEASLANLLQHYAGDADRLFVLGVDGKFVASAPAARRIRGVDYSRNEYVQEATSVWQPYVSKAYITEFASQPPELTIAVPLFDAKGLPVGLLCAAIDLGRAATWLAALTVLYSEVYVVDQRGFLIFGEGTAGLTPLRDLSADPNVALGRTGWIVRSEGDDLFSGARRYVGSASATGVDWTVFAANSLEPSQIRFAQLADGLLILRLTLLGLLLVAGLLFAQTTLRQQKIAVANLMKLNKQKSDFVSVVSHEFRTPLTGIQGFSEMIRDDELSMHDIKEFAGDINDDATRLGRMISEMLDLDRMESGKMERRRERVDLVSAARETAERMGANAPQHPLVLDLEAGMPPIWADRDRITQVITNLVSNAIKYSPDGGTVTVGVGTGTGTGTSAGMAHFWVHDHGMGIAPDSLETVFERYSRLGTVKTRTIQGTGLGLPIVREICQSHGGRAWAESVLGSGSTFHVSLPFDKRAAA